MTPENMKTSRPLSFIIITMIYVAAILIGIVVFNLSDSSAFNGYSSAVSDCVRLFISDFAATVFVWFFGVLFRNSSVYDPYWSVAPPVMISGYALYCDVFNLPVLLLQIAVWYWAIRLTGNWAYTFKSLEVQDWRYDMYKAKFPRLWHLVNFAGINLMPTIVVFLAMVPAFILINLGQIASCHANLWTWAGFFICMAAPTLQLVADTQAHRFRKAHKGQVCDIGLWSWSRHPNYLGEILMWWGVYVFLLTESNPSANLLIPAVGALVNTCLFVFISIPMMEKRQLANKPAYAEYRKKVRIL